MSGPSQRLWLWDNLRRLGWEDVVPGTSPSGRGHCWFPGPTSSDGREEAVQGLSTSPRLVGLDLACPLSLSHSSSL